MRALGLKRGGVCRLFAVEGALLGSVGSAVGVVMTVLVWGVIYLIQPTYIPPGGSSPVPLTVNLLALDYVSYALVFFPFYLCSLRFYLRSRPPEAMWWMRWAMCDGRL